MQSFLLIFVDVCLPILALAGIGWGLDRLFQLDLRTLIKLNIYLFVPAFILVRLSTSTLDGKAGLQIVVFTLLVITAMGLVSWLICRLRRETPAECAGMQLGTMIYNSGNWGIPLMTLAFPVMGPVVQVFVLATMNMSSFTLGVFLAGKGKEDAATGWRSLLPVFKLPSIYAITAALIFRTWGNPIDDIIFIWNPINYIADGLVAFALITLGVQLSKTQPPRPVGRLAWTLGVRMVGGPLVAIALTWVFGITGELAAILILGAAAPTAVNTALLAHEFNADSRFAAAAVFYSTLIAAFVVAVLLAILRAGGIPWATPPLS